jgi:hypothetical protein
MTIHLALLDIVIKVHQLLCCQDINGDVESCLYQNIDSLTHYSMGLCHTLKVDKVAATVSRIFHLIMNLKDNHLAIHFVAFTKIFAAFQRSF